MTWTAEEKLKAIVEKAGLAETELGLYLRREGLYYKKDHGLAGRDTSAFCDRKTLKKDASDEKISS